MARQLHILREAGLIRSGRSMADRRAILFTLEPSRHGVITAWLAGTEIARPTSRYSRGGAPQPTVELIERDRTPRVSEMPETSAAPEASAAPKAPETPEASEPPEASAPEDGSA